MRVPRVRVRLWWLMVVVAIAAIVTGGVVWVVRVQWLGAKYRSLAARHAGEVLRHRSDAKNHLVWLDGFEYSVSERLRKAAKRLRAYEAALPAAGERSPPRDLRFVESATVGLRQEMRRERELYVLASRLADHHASLEAKYRHAARHPWLPVEPDPPSPD